MSAELLRKAADRLDALADGATPGPWQEIGDGEDWYVCGGTEFREDVTGSGLPASDAAYIAAMSPTVGKALAAWLRLEAEVLAGETSPERLAALAVADAILARSAGA